MFPALFPRMFRVVMLTFSLVPAGVLASETAFCGEAPTGAAVSTSEGSPAHGRLSGAKPLPLDGDLQQLPLRHAHRCLNWGTERLIQALARAGHRVRALLPGSPPLGVGDLSRAQGGPIYPYSHSHQSGRDADLAFYAVDEQGRAVVMQDLLLFDAQGRAKSGQLRFDAKRTWLLVSSLLEDATIRVEWLFISHPLRALLLDEGRRQGASQALIARAAVVLHQPSDAPPHADHLHLRLLCTNDERRLGCRG